MLCNLHFLHPKGATLCFITGDVDYAISWPSYSDLSGELSSYQGTMQVHATRELRYEDALGDRYSSTTL
jgi:hypothetical protein